MFCYRLPTVKPPGCDQRQLYVVTQELHPCFVDLTGILHGPLLVQVLFTWALAIPLRDMKTFKTSNCCHVARFGHILLWGSNTGKSHSSLQNTHSWHLRKRCRHKSKRCVSHRSRIQGSKPTFGEQIFHPLETHSFHMPNFAPTICQTSDLGWLETTLHQHA